MRRVVLPLVVAMISFDGLAENASGTPGLKATYKTPGASPNVDVTETPNVWLYVPSGQSPSPFLPAGKFTSVWEGLIKVDLRGEYAFQAELNGALKLEVNGQTALDISGTNSISELSKPLRLNKGTNDFSATFSSPANGDAFVRVLWKPKESFVQPIPSAALTHIVSSEENTGKKLRLGRELFVEHRCAKCHVAAESGMPELAMDAPSLEEIGSRRNLEWMARWIAHPKALRVTAQMPKIFSGDSGKTNAVTIAAFLASLKIDALKTAVKEIAADQIETGKKLFETLHCIACHNGPGSSETDPKKVSLKNVREKFPAAALAEFLKQPNAHYSWIRMPRFKLTDEQREQITAFLFSTSEKLKEISVPADKNTIERGKKLLQTSGCLNCHSLKLENQFTTKALAQISNWKAGCLAEKRNENSKAPWFDFSVEEHDALQTFAATDHASLTRHVPVEFAERQSRGLNCSECHGKIEGIPPFEILGGKLKPEWASKFIAGEVSDKPRPWLDSQMPAFANRAPLLAEGLAHQQGFSSRTIAENPVDLAVAEIGRKLISVPPLGFSCVSCHSVGSVSATQVFEAPGINLASSGERLLPGFFKRWLRNPPLIDPTTKMPVYFDEEGKSPLTDVCDGNGEKQIDAIWQYIRLGEKMPAPKTQ